MTPALEEINKRIVSTAFETLFNRRDYERARCLWSPDYIHHSAHVPPGRDALLELVRNVPLTVRYENQLIVAHGDFVMLYGRVLGLGEEVINPTVVDIVRVENGVLAEHWDVIQDEATKAQADTPMFADLAGARTSIGVA
jgi:predicted SnoaL-like aldol condensation-catalyzing enzyme